MKKHISIKELQDNIKNLDSYEEENINGGKSIVIILSLLYIPGLVGLSPDKIIDL